MRFCSVSRLYLQCVTLYSLRLLCTECALKYKCFIWRYRSDPPMYSIVLATKISAYPRCSIYKSFKLLFQLNVVIYSNIFYMGRLSTFCAYIEHNARWNKSVLSDDIAAILPCNVLYLHPKYCHLLYIRYRRVLSCFYNAIL